MTPTTRCNWLVTLAAMVLSPIAFAQSSDELLDLETVLAAVKNGRISDNQINEQRLRAFTTAGADQAKLLAAVKLRQANLEDLSAAREAAFAANEERITDLELRLRERMGSLQELFGVLQQVASDAHAEMKVSLTGVEVSDRSEFLLDFARRMGQANRLPALTDIERLWFELSREMVASGEVVTKPQTVLTNDGKEIQRPVTRIGVFNVVADGKFLRYVPETGRLVEYERQPNGRYLAGAAALVQGDNEVMAVAIDPLRGQLLDMLTRAPNLRERVLQGGTIGYLIIGLGVAGILLGLARLGVLLARGREIRRQLAHLDAPTADNALGRVILAAEHADTQDVDTLELRLGEAVLLELPRINAYIPLLKIIAAVAPLMGLLGTVTGMILTFQSITLFGAGDPRLMAGGISQALMTTVLGLCVAIPMLLLHNVVSARAKTLTQILKQRAVALVAYRAEVAAGAAGRGDLQ
jgi:biopolymer transport protein ExbB